MTLRTVTICPNCKCVFIVNGIPETTTCRRCPKRHTFKKLKHYYQSEDGEAARKVLTKVSARVNDLGEHYERAKEKGVLEDHVDTVVEDDEYLEEMGADPEAAKEAEERAMEKKNRSKSQKEIVQDAITEQDNPGREDVREYAEKHGMDGEKALRGLDKLRQKGDVSGGANGPFRFV